jgi:hypothetical protein
VRVDSLGNDRDFLHAAGLQLCCGFDEPLHLGQLLLLVQRRRLEFFINPLLCGRFIRTRGRGGKQGSGHEAGSDSQ